MNWAKWKQFGSKDTTVFQLRWEHGMHISLWTEEVSLDEKTFFRQVFGLIAHESADRPKLLPRILSAEDRRKIPTFKMLLIFTRKSWATHQGPNYHAELYWSEQDKTAILQIHNIQEASKRIEQKTSPITLWERLITKAEENTETGWKRRIPGAIPAMLRLKRFAPPTASVYVGMWALPTM